MSVISQIKYLHLAYFSKPAHERCLYRAAKRQRVRSIVEMGVGDLERGRRLIAFAAQLHSPREKITYAGIDMFEARPAGHESLTLKQAYKKMIGRGAQVQLIPGEPFEALARTANSLMGTDLLIIAHDQNPASLQQAWYYVPRLLHPASVVFQEQAADDPEGSNSYRLLSHDEISQMVGSYGRRRAA